ncbi:MAG: efflux RND transporter permease subunit [Planctomycetota bacterium]|nr:efflux RND transporter permease subunit [Planctomycetota bacterium]
MLNAIIRFSLRYRMLVVVISLAMLIYGSYLATTMPIDVFPDLDRPRVIIITESPGLATEEVETLVTQPIEIALLGANGVKDVRSQTTAGLNVIYIEFDWTTEIRAARQTVQERLSSLEGILPAGIRPQMTPPSSIMGQIVIAGIYRQQGPNGGELTAIDKTDYLVELSIDDVRLPIEDDELRQSQINNLESKMHVWRAGDRRHYETWKEVRYTDLRWLDSAENGGHRATLRIDGTEFEVEFLAEQQRLMALRTVSDWVIRPRVLKVTGVAEVFQMGADRKQYQILVDPTALLEYGVSLQDVEHALQESNINTSGGFAITGETERPIRILGRLGPDSRVVLEDLRKVPVKVHEKRTILLGQVARVVEGPQFKRGDGSVNGRPGVVFTIVKQPHVDTRALTDSITAAFEEAEASLPADIVVNTELFQLKNFIDRGIFNVGEALVIGAFLVLIILFLFLLNFRTTFITLTAIPLSLVITTLVFRLIGYLTGSELSINVMTLGGVAVAMGELVDDAIVDVENIFRRLRNWRLAIDDCRLHGDDASEQSQIKNQKSAIQVVYEASMEIRSAIVFGTAVVILVFLPLFALSGVEGRLFAPLGVAYIVSILASLLVSLTVTPVLSYYLLPQSKATHQEHDGPLLRGMKWMATYLIRISMAWPVVLLVATWIGVGIAAWQFAQLGRNFLPQFDEGSVLVNVTLPPGSSLEASNATSGIIDAKFRTMQKTDQNPDGEILHFVRRTGRAEMDEHAAPVNAGEYILSMNPESGRHREETISELLSELREEVPGVDIEVEQPLAHLISHMVSGVYAQIAIKIHGDDLDTLQQLAERVRATIQTIPGLTPPVVEPIKQTEELHIRLRSDDLAFHGVTRAYVGQILQTALQGEVVSQVLEGQRRFDLLIRLEDTYRTDYANLGRLRIDLPDNRGQIELRELADIGEGAGPNAVNRENARRRIVIRCNTQDRDLASAVAEIEQRVQSQVVLPAGYFVEYGGQFESQQRATRLIVILAGVSVIGMFVVLMILFPSVRIVLQILNALPTAFIGGVAALVITQQDLTVASLVGFISLGGIAVRNGILLVTHYIHLMKEEGEEFTPEMIMRGSLERLAPVLMTALTAGIGLVPLVLGGQEPGREILYPVATVILGGLVTSTFCEFLIHPGLFLKFSGKDAAAVARSHELEGNSENLLT